MVDSITPVVTAHAHAQAATPYIPWFERVDLFQIVAVAMVGVVAWFLVRTLKQIDVNQRVTADTLQTITKEFYTLQGEHKVYHDNHKFGGLK